MFFSPVIAPWLDLSIKAGHLAFETQAVVGLRLFGMATGTVPVLAETERMIPEKVAALTDAQALVVEGGVTDGTARKVVALYRGGVKANKDRFQEPLHLTALMVIVHVQSIPRPLGQHPRRERRPHEGGSSQEGVSSATTHRRTEPTRRTGRA